MNPIVDNSVTPIMATPIARDHCLSLERSDIIRKSEIAPIVQKLVRCMITPSAKVTRKLAHRAWWLIAVISTVFI